MASNKFTAQDLVKLQQKGLVINDPVLERKVDVAFKIPRTPVKGKKEKDYIEMMLIGIAIPYEKEYRFHDTRKFRFDYAISSYKIGIEYNGIMSEKSRHTSIVGYSVDLTKINLAQLNGWIVLQYSPLTYKSVYDDVIKAIELRK